MKRRLFSLVALLCHLLCLAASAAWVNGYRATDHVWLSYAGGGTDAVASSRGLLQIRHSTWPSQADAGSVGRDLGTARAWYCRRRPGPLHANPAQGSYRYHRQWGPFSWASSPPEPMRPKDAAALADLRLAIAQAEARARDQPESVTEQVKLFLLKTESETLEFRKLAEHYSEWQFVFPTWLLVAAAAAPPALWLPGVRRRRLQRRRRRAGLCPRCGYNLSATPNRCPECGAAAPTPDVDK